MTHARTIRFSQQPFLEHQRRRSHRARSCNSRDQALGSKELRGKRISPLSVSIKSGERQWLRFRRFRILCCRWWRWMQLRPTQRQKSSMTVYGVEQRCVEQGVMELNQFPNQIRLHSVLTAQPLTTLLSHQSLQLDVQAQPQRSHVQDLLQRWSTVSP